MSSVILTKQRNLMGELVAVTVFIKVSHLCGQALLRRTAGAVRAHPDVPGPQPGLGEAHAAQARGHQRLLAPGGAQGEFPGGTLQLVAGLECRALIGSGLLPGPTVLRAAGRADRGLQHAAPRAARAARAHPERHPVSSTQTPLLRTVHSSTCF